MDVKEQHTEEVQQLVTQYQQQIVAEAEQWRDAEEKRIYELAYEEAEQWKVAEEKQIYDLAWTRAREQFDPTFINLSEEDFKLEETRVRFGISKGKSKREINKRAVKLQKLRNQLELDIQEHLARIPTIRDAMFTINVLQKICNEDQAFLDEIKKREEEEFEFMRQREELDKKIAESKRARKTLRNGQSTELTLQ